MILRSLLILLGLEAAAAAESPQSGSVGTVYVVLAIDTETRTLPPYDSIPVFDLSDFDDTGSVGRMMVDSVREQYLDSDNNPACFTWFAMTHEAFIAAGRSGALVSRLLGRYKGDMARFGDEIGWHYHHCDWQNSPTGGSWQQLTTFSGRQENHGTDIELAEQMVAVLIIERGEYPTVFRAGWVWENTEFSNWLDSIVPFDFSNAAPLSHGEAVVEGGVDKQDLYDWSRARADWQPYHPSQCDYQLPGESHRTIFRCLPGHRSSDLRLESAFERAARGEDVVVAAYTHSYNDMEKFCRVVSGSVNNARIMYPQVRFKYVNALEAAQAALNLTDTTPPTFRVQRDGRRFTLILDEPLFAFPFGAIRTFDNHYRRVRPLDVRPDTTLGDYRWTFDLRDLPYDIFAAGGTDPAGNGFVTDLYGPEPLTPPQAHEKTDNH